MHGSFKKLAGEVMPFENVSPWSAHVITLSSKNLRT